MIEPTGVWRVHNGVLYLGLKKKGCVDFKLGGLRTSLYSHFKAVHIPTSTYLLPEELFV